MTSLLRVTERRTEGAQEVKRKVQAHQSFEDAESQSREHQRLHGQKELKYCHDCRKSQGQQTRLS